MSISEKNKVVSSKEQSKNMMSLIILFSLGLILLYGFYRIDNSETVSNYFDLAAGDPSGFRYIVFLGILKYGILLMGIALTIISAVMLVKKLKIRMTQNNV